MFAQVTAGTGFACGSHGRGRDLLLGRGIDGRTRQWEHGLRAIARGDPERGDFHRGVSATVSRMRADRGRCGVVLGNPVRSAGGIGRRHYIVEYGTGEDSGELRTAGKREERLRSGITGLLLVSAARVPRNGIGLLREFLAMTFGYCASSSQ